MLLKKNKDYYFKIIDKIEKKESSVLTLSDRLKCFSITHAPSDTAATGTIFPIEWSEKPTGKLNLSFK